MWNQELMTDGLSIHLCFIGYTWYAQSLSHIIYYLFIYLFRVLTREPLPVSVTFILPQLKKTNIIQLSTFIVSFQRLNSSSWSLLLALSLSKRLTCDPPSGENTQSFGVGRCVPQKRGGEAVLQPQIFGRRICLANHYTGWRKRRRFLKER